MRIVEKPEMLIVGMVSTAGDIRDINVDELWQDFSSEVEQIQHRILGKNYEIHIDDLCVNKYYCIVGVEVERIESLPVEMFVKVIPAGKYLIFTHEFKDGELGEAYKLMNDWFIENECTQAFPMEILCYDERFLGMENPDSALDFYIPIKTK